MERPSFQTRFRRPAPSQLEPREGSNARDAGTRDAGPSALPRALRGRPFSSRPGSSGKPGLYAFSGKRQADAPVSSAKTAAAPADDPEYVRLRPIQVRRNSMLPGDLSRALTSGDARCLRARPRGSNVGCIHLSRPRQPGGRHGQGARRRVCVVPGRLRRGRCRARRKALQNPVGGTLRDAHPDRERSAGAHGGAAFVAGHSLGEYSALAAAGSLTISDAARLLRIRGRAMQRAVAVGAGAMAALIGLELEAAAAVAAEAAENQVCEVANDNGGGQVVVSGDKAAVERAIEIAKARGAKRALLLPVSAPFHCALMRPAAEAMAEALGDATLKPPVVPLVCNVTARPATAPDDIVRRLIEQVTGTVRWRESVTFMASSGVRTFYEVGAGKVLSGLVRRIADSAVGVAVGTPSDVSALQAGRKALTATI